MKSAVIEKSEALNNNNMKPPQKELKMSEVAGEKTKNIRFLIDALKTVPPGKTSEKGRSLQQDVS